MKPFLHPATLILLLSIGLSACQAQPMPLAQPLPATRLQSQSAAGLSHAGRKLQSNLIGLFDKNQDGRLDRSELKIPLLLRLLDKNFDGFVTRDELSNPLADKLIVTFLRETAKKLYALADRDDDQALSYQEFIVSGEIDHKLLHILFQMVDNNFDDRLDLAEYEDFIAQSIAVGGEGFAWLERSAQFQDAVK